MSDSDLLDAVRAVVREELIATLLPPELVDADQLGAMLGLSRASVYRLNDAGQLPRPIPIDLRGVRWSVREVRAWVSVSCPTRVAWESMRGSILKKTG